MSQINPIQGEVWNIDFDPSLGQEIRKTRPALVMSARRVGRAQLRIVAPITTGKPFYDNFYWMVRVRATSANGLDHDSFADASQIKSLSVRRFLERRGLLEPSQIAAIEAAVALCIKYRPPRRTRR